MGVVAKIVDSEGRSITLEEEGQMPVVVYPHPPRNGDPVAQPLPFRQHFTDNGFTTGSSDMIVDGSVTPIVFFIAAEQELDIYIKSISVLIGDSGAGMNLQKFGNLAALTTGVEWSHFTSEGGDYILHDGIKTNLEFIRLGEDTGAIGTGVDAYLADVSGGGGEKSYLPNIDMEGTFGIQWGLRLRKGTKDKVCFTIRDAMSGLDTFNAIGYGIRW